MSDAYRPWLPESMESYSEVSSRLHAEWFRPVESPFSMDGEIDDSGGVAGRVHSIPYVVRIRGPVVIGRLVDRDEVSGD